MVVTSLGRAARRGFTLVELVIVVLVIGIIAAIAAPKMMSTANDARANGTKQSLRGLRQAIELHRSEVGTLPTVANLKTAVAKYLQGPFPGVQIGSKQNDQIATGTGDPMAAPTAGSEGWIYNASTGELRINEATYFAW